MTKNPQAIPPSGGYPGQLNTVSVLSELNKQHIEVCFGTPKKLVEKYL